MNPHRFLLLSVILAGSLCAAETPAPTAAELASHLSALRQDGSSFIRARMQIKDPSGAVKTTLQVQIKSRAGKSGTELVYQLQWPKERKGEAILLRGGGRRSAGGAVLLPPAPARPLAASEMVSIFGSNLTPEDLLENFYAWDSQAIVGTEAIDHVQCQILESRFGKGGRSVKSWIDPRRMVPLRIEKYSPSGQLFRRIETTRVATDDLGHPTPANLILSGPHDATTTEMDGSRIKHGVTYTDRDFTPEGLSDMTAPRAGE